MILIQVPAGDVPDIAWSEPTFVPLLSTIALRRKCSQADVVRELMDGETQLHLVVDGKKLCAVILTQILFRHGGRGTNCRVIACAGADAGQWLHLIADLETWARGMGCKMMEPLARPGWAKLLKQHGYRMTHVVLEKDLT